eukprot:3701067-Alexandrium_andersonii.AAC.1
MLELAPGAAAEPEVAELLEATAVAEVPAAAVAGAPDAAVAEAPGAAAVAEPPAVEAGGATASGVGAPGVEAGLEGSTDPS